MRHSFCKNHPLKGSSTRCYQCKGAICQKCIHHLAHHYFCSYKCYLSYRISYLQKKLKPYTVAILAVSQVIVFSILIFLFLIENFKIYEREINPGSVLNNEAGSHKPHFLSQFFKNGFEFEHFCAIKK